MTSSSTPLSLDLPPMEAEAVDELPSGPGWQYEPKYDGFRCLAHRRGDRAHLQSKNQKPLERYFPEVAQGLEEIAQDDFVLDGELVIAGGSFESLQLRLHPAESRIRKLALETPAELIVFDLLARSGISLLERPLSERRRALEDFMAQAASSVLKLGEATDQGSVARDWLGREGLDGIVSKRLDLPYQPGERAMRKFKLWKTIDCVVGGLYRKRGTQAVEHLLLGLYDQEGLLNYVGRARISADAAEIGRLLEPLIGGQGFTGRAPGGKSRWSGKERMPVPLEPVLVVEVSADHITGEHMRHGARLSGGGRTNRLGVAPWTRSGEGPSVEMLCLLSPAASLSALAEVNMVIGRRSGAAEGLEHAFVGLRRLGVAGECRLVLVRPLEHCYELLKPIEIVPLNSGHDRGFDLVVARDEGRVHRLHDGPPAI